MIEAHQLQPGSRPLSVGERASLAMYASLVVSAEPGRGRDIAVAAAAGAARRCRETGASWVEIVGALGIEADDLREWLGDTTPKRGARARAPAPAVLLSRLLIAVGSAMVKGNDFAGEVAAIRAAMTPLPDESVIERFNVDIGGISRGLIVHAPSVLHVAAHSDLGCVFLCLDGAASAVEHTSVYEALIEADIRPVLVVLNFCDSEELARAVTANTPIRPPAARAAIAWRGIVDDLQARIFATHLYRGLSRGEDVQRSFTFARRTIMAAWPGQATPCLAGEGSVIPFPSYRDY